MSTTGIFNVLDYGLDPANAPGVNTTQLQNLVDLLFDSSGPTNGNGGTIEFPMYETGTYLFAGTINITSNPSALRFIGTCISSFNSSDSPPQVPTLMQVPTEDVPDPGDLFYLSNSVAANSNVGGIIFQDLYISYDESLTDGAAIHVNKAQNVRVFRVTFLNCPQAVFLQHSLQCSILECTALCGINIDSCIVLGDHPTEAIETYIAGCLFRSGNGGTGVLVHDTEHVRMMNVRLEGFEYGLYIQPKGKSVRGHYANVTARQSSAGEFIGGGLVIQPQTGGDGNIQENVFVGCEFGPSDDAGTSYILGGMYIDEVDGAIDTLRFVSCTSLNWPGSGMQILGGSNIEVLGGQYSSNGQAEDTVQAGIAITGPANGVRIVGVSAIGSVLSMATQPIGVYVAMGCTNVLVKDCDLSANGQYGLYVGTGGGSAPTYVFVSGCNLRSNGTGPIDFASPGTGIQVLNCPGYNDQGTPVHMVAPSGTFSGVTFGYYGPVEFYASLGGIFSIEIDGHTTGLTSGSFYLVPGETAQINSSGIPTFLMIGK